ncbi:MAG: hypothetical protein ACTSRW_13500 [Candidatus Helarchaeota archaeon]
MSENRLATANAAAILGAVCGIWMILSGVLFLAFNTAFTDKLVPLDAILEAITLNPALGNVLFIPDAILNFIFAGVEMVGGFFVYTRKYRLGGSLILIISLVSIIVGGGFWVGTLWGVAAGAIAFLCPNLESRIAAETADSS